MFICAILRCGGLLYLVELCCHEGEQRLHRLKPSCLPRDEMFDTPRDTRGVQRCLGSKLHHKGVLNGEGTCKRGLWQRFIISSAVC